MIELFVLRASSSHTLVGKKSLFKDLNWLQYTYVGLISLLNQSVEFRTTKHKVAGTLIAILYILALFHYFY